MVEAAAQPRQHIVVLFMTEEGPKSLDHRGSQQRLRRGDIRYNGGVRYRGEGAEKRDRSCGQAELAGM